MTNSTSHSDKKWDSRVWFDAEAVDGVRYAILKISFGQRIELARRIREIGRKLEYLEAGTTENESMEATVLAAEIDRAYLDWGLMEVEGLLIDGIPASPLALVEQGPVDLAIEILGHIRAECGMSEAERKN